MGVTSSPPRHSCWKREVRFKRNWNFPNKRSYDRAAHLETLQGAFNLPAVKKDFSKQLLKKLSGWVAHQRHPQKVFGGLGGLYIRKSESSFLFRGGVFKKPTTGNLIEPAAAFMPRATTPASKWQRRRSAQWTRCWIVVQGYPAVKKNKKKTQKTKHFHTKSSPQKLWAKVVLKSAVSHFCPTITDGFGKQSVLSWPQLNDTEIIIEVGLIGIH